MARDRLTRKLGISTSIADSRQARYQPGYMARWAIRKAVPSRAQSEVSTAFERSRIQLARSLPIRRGPRELYAASSEIDCLHIRPCADMVPELKMGSLVLSRLERSLKLRCGLFIFNPLQTQNDLRTQRSSLLPRNAKGPRDEPGALRASSLERQLAFALRLAGRPWMAGPSRKPSPEGGRHRRLIR